MKKIAFFICIFLSVSALASGGDVVNNGGGASEQALVYAYQAYAPLVAACANSTVCALSAPESQTLNALISSLDSEQKQPLVFLTSREMGESQFQTEARLGAPIMVNKDKLWRVAPEGSQIAFSIDDSVCLLTRVLGVHHPEFEGAIVETLAKKLALALNQKTLNQTPHPHSPHLHILTIRGANRDHILVEDGYATFLDLGELIVGALGCPVTEFSAYSLNWGPYIMPGSDPIHLVIRGRISWRCQDTDRIFRASVIAVFNSRPVTGTVDEFWENMGGVPLQILPAPPEIRFSGERGEWLHLF